VRFGFTVTSTMSEIIEAGKKLIRNAQDHCATAD
jgi:hypothetical protein